MSQSWLLFRFQPLLVPVDTVLAPHVRFNEQSGRTVSSESNPTVQPGFRDERAVDEARGRPATTLFRTWSSLRDGTHRHGHDGLLFTTLRLDDRGPVHPPHDTICKGNLVGGFFEVIDLQL